MGIFSRSKRDETLDETKVDDLLLRALLQGGTVDRDTALSIPTVSACVDLICNTFAMIPFKLYKETVTDGKRATEEVEDGRVAIINEDTTDTLDGFQFKKAICEDYLMGKGGYAYVKKIGNGLSASADGNALKQLAHLREEHHRRSFGCLTHGKGTDGCDAHEKVFVKDLTSADTADRLPQNVISHQKVGGKKDEYAFKTGEGEGFGEKNTCGKEKGREQDAPKCFLLFSVHHSLILHSGSTLEIAFWARATISLKRLSSAFSIIFWVMKLTVQSLTPSIPLMFLSILAAQLAQSKFSSLKILVMINTSFQCVCKICAMPARKMPETWSSSSE